MPKPRTYKYVCADCKAENWLSPVDRDRAARARCSSCGSLYLDPAPYSVGRGAIMEHQAAAAVRKAARKRKAKLQ